MTSRILLIVSAAVMLTGCGLSASYQRQSLVGAGPTELCYAAADPRIGGFAVRAEVARQMLDQEGIACDWQTQAMLHQGQAEAQQAGIATSLGAIGAGIQMTQPQPIPPTFIIEPR